MIGSVHLADVGAAKLLRLLVRGGPKPADVPGLRYAHVAAAAQLRRGALPRPGFGRAGLIALWDDDAALDAFEASHPLAAALADGWRVRLAPLRAHGTWPGLDEAVPRERVVDHDGPVVVITLGRLRLSQALRFNKASGAAERAVMQAPGLLWATAFTRPPLLATCSVWEDSKATMAYAFAGGDPAHPAAIAQGQAKPFHHQEAFIRFAPYAAQGGLGGRNPLRAGLLPAT